MVETDLKIGDHIILNGVKHTLESFDVILDDYGNIVDIKYTFTTTHNEKES